MSDDKHQMQSILSALTNISPLDHIELSDINVARALVCSEEKFIRSPSEISNKHIVVIILLLRKNYVLLGNHIKACDWLPIGGHLEPLETLTECAIRELWEELYLKDHGNLSGPFFVSQVITNDLNDKHTDVGFWFILKLDDDISKLNFNNEFSELKWFDLSELPITPLGHNLSRAIKKLPRD
ncbi:NUDIX domain-containing protein [Klebsiella variicola]|uniref:NUDIX domain-containing protein n=1 Tax=Klebsiella variicola TaxID=244366 RepID=UPI00103461C8|nr:NUDIX hydrolase [Klebsiella variicola]